MVLGGFAGDLGFQSGSDFSSSFLQVKGGDICYLNSDKRIKVVWFSNFDGKKLKREAEYQLTINI